MMARQKKLYTNKLFFPRIWKMNIESTPPAAGVRATGTGLDVLLPTLPQRQGRRRQDDDRRSQWWHWWGAKNLGQRQRDRGGTAQVWRWQRQGWGQRQHLRHQSACWKSERATTSSTLDLLFSLYNARIIWNETTWDVYFWTVLVVLLAVRLSRINMYILMETVINWK